MKEHDELRFAELCDGGRLAHYLSPGMITGVPPRFEFYATRESVWRRFRKGVELNLSVTEDARALAAFRRAAGESDDMVDSLEYMMGVDVEEGFWG